MLNNETHDLNLLGSMVVFSDGSESRSTIDGKMKGDGYIYAISHRTTYIYISYILINRYHT